MIYQRAWIFIFSLVLCFAASGCLKTYQELELKSDMSGTVAFIVTYDMETLINSLSVVQGGNDDEEMAKMIKENLKGQVEEKMKLPPEAEITSHLPKGIKLMELKLTEDGSKRKINIKFGFDHVNKLKVLKDVKLFKNIPKEFGGIQIPVSDPLQQIKDIVIEKKGTDIIISQKVGSIELLQNKELQNTINTFWGEEFLGNMIKNTGFYFRIKVPAETHDVADHTASKYDKQKQTLYWNYGSSKIKELIDSGKAPEAIYAKLKEKSKKTKNE